MSILISKKTADREIYLLYQPPHQSHTMPSLMRFSDSATKKKFGSLSSYFLSSDFSNIIGDQLRTPIDNSS